MSTVAEVAHQIPTPGKQSKLHLYLAWGCPYCHRVLAAMVLAGISDQVGITWMRNTKGADGWQIASGDDPLSGETSLACVYQLLDPDKRHARSVPLLIDLSDRKLLSTSSSQITRFFSKGMNGACRVERELAPVHLVDQIDKMNLWLHEHINQAVYQVGFATQQRDYEVKVVKLFQSIDELEQRLTHQAFLLGDTLTESDLYLLATLVRFDSVYFLLFKCSLRLIADYKALRAYLARLQSIEGVSNTYNSQLIKEHYFCSVMHVNGEVRDLNPARIIPVTPLNSL